MLRQDGLDEWWPDPALLPPQQPAGASMAELLHAVPTNDTAWLAFGNAGATEMLMNWVYHTLKLKLGSKLVIAAYDNELLTYLRVRFLPLLFTFTRGFSQAAHAHAVAAHAWVTVM